MDESNNNRRHAYYVCVLIYKQISERTVVGELCALFYTLITYAYKLQFWMDSFFSISLSLFALHLFGVRFPVYSARTYVLFCSIFYCSLLLLLLLPTMFHHS